MSITESCESESVTEWIDQLKLGDSYAAQKLWRRYISELVRLADKMLGRRRLRLGDGEDVASRAFSSFLKCVENGKFPNLSDREDLWQIMVMLTDRRAKDHLDKEFAKKRGNNKIVDRKLSHHRNNNDDECAGLDWLVDQKPTPDFAVQFAEEIKIMFDRLDSDELRRIAMAKLEGYTNREIAEKEQLSQRTIERRLKLIRAIWELGDNDD